MPTDEWPDPLMRVRPPATDEVPPEVLIQPKSVRQQWLPPRELDPYDEPVFRRRAKREDRRKVPRDWNYVADALFTVGLVVGALILFGVLVASCA